MARIEVEIMRKAGMGIIKWVANKVVGILVIILCFFLFIEFTKMGRKIKESEGWKFAWDKRKSEKTNDPEPSKIQVIYEIKD